MIPDNTRITISHKYNYEFQPYVIILHEDIWDKTLKSFDSGDLIRHIEMETKLKESYEWLKKEDFRCIKGFPDTVWIKDKLCQPTMNY